MRFITNRVAILIVIGTVYLLTGCRDTTEDKKSVDELLIRIVHLENRSHYAGFAANLFDPRDSLDGLAFEQRGYFFVMSKYGVKRYPISFFPLGGHYYSNHHLFYAVSENDVRVFSEDSEKGTVVFQSSDFFILYVEFSDIAPRAIVVGRNIVTGKNYLYAIDLSTQQHAFLEIASMRPLAAVFTDNDYALITAGNERITCMFSDDSLPKILGPEQHAYANSTSKLVAVLKEEEVFYESNYYKDVDVSRLHILGKTIEFPGEQLNCIFASPDHLWCVTAKQNVLAIDSTGCIVDRYIVDGGDIVGCGSTELGLWVVTSAGEAKLYEGAGITTYKLVGYDDLVSAIICSL